MNSGLKISGTLEQEFEEVVHIKLSEASFAYFSKKESKRIGEAINIETYFQGLPLRDHFPNGPASVVIDIIAEDPNYSFAPGWEDWVEKNIKEEDLKTIQNWIEARVTLPSLVKGLDFEALCEEITEKFGPNVDEEVLEKAIGLLDDRLYEIKYLYDFFRNN
jgi:hypothetical protein